MRRDRAPFALASLVLSLVLVASALLPPEHIHPAGIEGRTHSIVHRHSLYAFGPGPLAPSIVAHGSHERALFLTTSYDSAPQFVAQPPALIETPVITTPGLGPLRSFQADDAQRAHSPPDSPCPTRAPPSFA
jgi:hypothetical protein